RDESEKKVIKEFVEALSSVRFGLGAVSLDGGFGLNIVSVFSNESEAAKKFLTALRAGDGAASLRGLPEGNAIFATSARGDGTQNGLIASVMLREVMHNLLEANKVFSAVDRPVLMTVFNEIWQRLRGTRLGLYRTADASELGLFSIV